jgi:hypothetical protein
MLISGLELTLGTFAARAHRGRKVSRSRWAGVGIVAVRDAIVERANRGRHVRTNEDAAGGGEDRNTGGPTRRTRRSVSPSSSSSDPVGPV